MNPISVKAMAGIHPWEDATGWIDADGLEGWVQNRLQWHQQQIDALLAVEAPRTIENTLRPYDEVISTLSAAGSQTSLLDSVHPDKDVRDRARALTQAVAEAGTALSLNQQVYHALAAIDLTATTAADPATDHYLSQTLLNYRLAGVDKDDATRDRVRDLSDKVTELSLFFAKNVQEGANQVTVTDTAELDGLPPDYIHGHPADADGVITLTTDFPDMQPVMTFARSEDLRLRMFRAYNTRAYPANRQLLMEVLALRQQIATILGFSCWADLATANQMMGSAANMTTFIDELEVSSRAGAEREYAMVLDFARRQQPGLSLIRSSDRSYWYEQYRRDAFAFDSQSVRPYFPYAAVEAGVLETAAQLFQVTFAPNEQAGVWHPDVSAWNVLDHGQLCGRFYLDMHPREGKDKWFSAAPLIPGIAGRQLPEVALICNFPGGGRGQPGDPGLMQYNDVVTFFHEFGHLMHAILGGQQRWAGVSGISTEGDFVEVPSQMLEEFFRDPGLLARFARHYETGEPIPAALVERMNRASAFGRADFVRTQLFYTRYSLEVHSMPPDDLDLDQLLREGYRRLLPYEWVDGNRMYASFSHLIGYTSNYYTYMFDKVIALDFFAQFDGTNLLDGAAALRYRQSVLEPGGSKPAAHLIEDFLGRRQTMDAFVAWIGEEFTADSAHH